MTTNEKNTEQIILEVAEREFMEKGFSGTKTTSIASAAGVTHAMLHYYFRTKENLFSKVYESRIALLENAITASFMRTDISLLDRIKNIVEAHFDFFAENPNLPRFVINEFISKPKHFEIFKNKIQKIAGVIIDKLQEEINTEAANGNIERVMVIDLFINIISLNLFVFISYPIMEQIALPFYPDKATFLEARKRENVETIMRRLKK